MVNQLFGLIPAAEFHHRTLLQNAKYRPHHVDIWDPQGKSIPILKAGNASLDHSSCPYKAQIRKASHRYQLLPYDRIQRRAAPIIDDLIGNALVILLLPISGDPYVPTLTLHITHTLNANFHIQITVE
ncbi:unnamed protein product [Leptidea sinapis]|uniref:Uncharacterized protein n=1 Tax=Leptidea sinapis TaxID=189913 RepID=A0A5E4R679_9NEOP|nr:unnamed protein product [Leptidea sinapis]